MSTETKTVELSFHESTTRQIVKDVVTVIYTESVAVVYQTNGVMSAYPLVSLHRIKETPDQ